MGATTIGEALAAKRLELGLEKGQAAQRIGMSRTTYSSYEQDAQRPSVEVFSAIADFLGVSMDEVLALYGATCIVQARNFLSRVTPDSPVGGDSLASTSEPSIEQADEKHGTDDRVIPASSHHVASTSNMDEVIPSGHHGETAVLARTIKPDEVDGSESTNKKRLNSEGSEKVSGHKKKKKKKSKKG